MSQYRIQVEGRARRVLTKLDKPVRRRLQKAIDELADDPRPATVTPLVGRPGQLRKKVGDYRVIYEVHDHVLLVLVVDLNHRSKVYRIPD